MKHTLVTGGCGFIGTHLVQQLVNEGCEVTVIDRRHPAERIPGVHYITERIGGSTCNDVMLFNYMDGMDIVYHLAAEPRIQSTIDNPSRAFYDNCLATQQVLEAARHVETPRVVFSSTSSVYGRTEHGHESCEDDNREYLNPYAVSKGVCEDWCKLYYDLYGVNVVTLRYFNVYGDDQDESQVVGKFLAQAKLNKSLTVNGTGDQTRDFTFIKDIIAGTIYAGNINIPNPAGNIINLGSGHSYAIKDLARAISSKIMYGDSMPGETMHTLANNDKAYHMLGWSPTVDILQWLEEQD